MTNLTEIELQHEFDYMLNEVSALRESLNEYLQRFEQLVTFHLTGVTALGGAIVLVLTSNTNTSSTLLVIAILLLALAGFGSGSFLRMCSAKVGISVTYSLLTAREFYFFDRFAHLKKYTQGSRDDEYAKQIWKVASFTPQVVRLLTAIYLFNSMIIGLSASLLMQAAFRTISPLSITIATIAFLIVAIVSIWLSHSFLKKQINKAKDLCEGRISLVVTLGENPPETKIVEELDNEKLEAA